ncbi:MAG: signal peptidase I [Candidatus Thorarchaeota archaeon]
MNLRTKLRRELRSEKGEILFTLVTILTIALSGYTSLMLTMGTTSPLVVVTSESMRPNLERGDLLVIQARSEEYISLGDIIVFWTDWHPDSPIVHRVVEIIEDQENGRQFVTKGDNNPTNDRGERTIEDLLGVVVLRIPFIGHVSMFLQTTLGVLIFTVVIIELFILSELFEKYRNVSTTRNEWLF